MAEALFRRAYGTRVFVESCGLASRVGAGVAGIDPFVASVMAEVGCDVSDYRPHDFEDLADGSFDLIISLTPDAHERALVMARGRAMETEYWPTPDPTGAGGSRENHLEAYREVRQILQERIAARFGA